MKLLVIDGNSIMNRAFYGIRTLTNSQGVNTNALYGFLTTLHRHLKEEEECRVAAAFDLKAPTYRHETERTVSHNKTNAGRARSRKNRARGA